MDVFDDSPIHFDEILQPQKFEPIDGGPAFGEFQQAGDCSIKTGGMSLRDYFAAKAMQGMLACPRLYASDEHMLSRDAYTTADAMLAERAK